MSHKPARTEEIEKKEKEKKKNKLILVLFLVSPVKFTKVIIDLI